MFDENPVAIGLAYIRQNPVQAGFVAKEYWKYSSAGNFYGTKGLVTLCYS